MKAYPIHIGDDLSLLTTPTTGVTVTPINPIDMQPLNTWTTNYDTSLLTSVQAATAALANAAKTVQTIKNANGTTTTIPTGSTLLSTAGASSSNTMLFVGLGIISLAFLLKNRL